MKGSTGTYTVDLEIESLDERAQGVAHYDGKRFFIDGALPGERVRAFIARDKATYALGRAESVVRASPSRVAPRCPHFGVCGGCVLQHVDASTQVALKQKDLEDAFHRIAGLKPQQILPPLHGPQWAYRHRARLAVRFVPAQGGVLLGFHERKRSFVADIRVCHVLPKQVSDLLEPLHDLIAALSIPHRIPQIQVAVGDPVAKPIRKDSSGTRHVQATCTSEGPGAVVLVLRHLLPLTQDDIELLRAFGARHGVSWWLRPGGPETAMPLNEDIDSKLPEGDSPMSSALSYELPRFGLKMRFRPADFIQANLAANRALVSRALDLLQVGPADRVLDLFCGLGNFTLPLATQAQHVIGVEGSKPLLERAQRAAQEHGHDAHVRFICADLFQVDAHWLRGLGRFDAILLDPPREGARAVAEALVAAGRQYGPRRIVYVSCNPITLARDTAILVHKGGYRLKVSGLVNMFPHTAHIEAVSVFE